MPEGPEVAWRANELRQLLVGKNYHEIILVSGSYKNKKDELHESFRSSVSVLNRIAKKPRSKLQFTRVAAKGKYMYFELQLFLENAQSGKWESKGYKYIGTHFMMTGAWRSQPANHVRVELLYGFSGGNDIGSGGERTIETLYYDDQRDFGRLEVLTTTQLQNELNAMGPDILGKITEEQFRSALEPASRSMVGSALKDQKLISGIGNYMRADILYLAKIDPTRKLVSLSPLEWKKLYDAAREVATTSLAAGGTASYNPESGHYVPIIYGKTKDAHGNPVATIKSGGQTLYWVPKIQK